MVVQVPNEYPLADHLAELGRIPLTTVLLERDCLGYGLSTFRSSGQAFIAADGSGARMGFHKAGTALNSRPSSPLTKDKHSTRALLQRHGLPAPRGRRFRPHDFASASAYAEELGYPVVLKPLHGTQGRGVVTGITSPQDLEWAFQDISRTSFAEDDVLLEEHIEGETYRIIVIGNRAVSALISRHGQVTGDGRRTVRELIGERQELRRRNPHLMSRLIRMDERMEHLLARQGVGLGDVLPAGETVEFTYGSNTHQGGEPAQVLGRMHPSILEASASAVAAVPGLEFAGVDFIIPDITRPLDQQPSAICEINSVPAADSHEFPLYGEPVSVTREMVRHTAERTGLHLTGFSEDVSLAVRLQGGDFQHHYVEWIAEKARAMDLDGDVQRPELDLLEGTLCGEVAHAAVWLALALRGPDPQHTPAAASVEVRHV